MNARRELEINVERVDLEGKQNKNARLVLVNIMTFPISVPLLVLVLLGETGAQEDPLLPFTEHLDSDRLVTLKWGFDDIQGNITFELCVNTTGWISFGLSPNGGMTGADIVIGGVNSDGYYFGVSNNSYAAYFVFLSCLFSTIFSLAFVIRRKF